MGRDADRHIRVSESTWKQLNARKEPGDSFDDVLVRLLDEVDGSDIAGNRKPATSD